MARKAATTTKRKYKPRTKGGEQLVARCQFENTPGKLYDYLVPTGMKVVVGGLGIVPANTKYDNYKVYGTANRGWGLNVVKIISITNDISKATRFLVGSVDMKEVERLEALAKEVQEVLEKRRDAKRQLDEMLRQHVEEQKYAILASNPAARELMAILVGDA